MFLNADYLFCFEYFSANWNAATRCFSFSHRPPVLTDHENHNKTAGAAPRPYCHDRVVSHGAYLVSSAVRLSPLCSQAVGTAKSDCRRSTLKLSLCGRTGICALKPASSYDIHSTQFVALFTSLKNQSPGQIHLTAHHTPHLAALDAPTVARPARPGHPGTSTRPERLAPAPRPRHVTCPASVAVAHDRSRGWSGDQLIRPGPVGAREI